LLGFQQGMADPPIQAHLLIDGLAGLLELLLVTALGTVEQPADEAVVQIDDFINDGGLGFKNDGNQCGVLARGVKIAQVLGGHLSAFAGDSQEPVAVYLTFDPIGQQQRFYYVEPVDMFQHVPGGWCAGRLAQPDHRAGVSVLAGAQQAVQLVVMRIGQGFGQCRMNAPRGPCDGFGTNPLDHVDGRQKDRLTAEVLNERRRQRDAFVCLTGEIVQLVSSSAVVSRREELKPEDRLQFGQMFPPRLFPPSIVGP